MKNVNFIVFYIIIIFDEETLSFVLKVQLLLIFFWILSSTLSKFLAVSIRLFSLSRFSLRAFIYSTSLANFFFISIFLKIWKNYEVYLFHRSEYWQSKFKIKRTHIVNSLILKYLISIYFKINYCRRLGHHIHKKIDYYFL